MYNIYNKKMVSIFKFTRLAYLVFSKDEILFLLVGYRPVPLADPTAYYLRSGSDPKTEVPKKWCITIALTGAQLVKMKFRM